jgi:hypothetical protein
MSQANDPGPQTDLRLLAIEQRLRVLEAQGADRGAARRLCLSYFSAPKVLLDKVQSDVANQIFDLTPVLTGREAIAVKVRITQYNVNGADSHNYATFTTWQRGEDTNPESIFTVRFEEYRHHYNAVPFDFDVPWKPQGSPDMIVKVSGTLCDGTYSTQGNQNSHKLSVIGCLEYRAL